MVHCIDVFKTITKRYIFALHHPINTSMLPSSAGGSCGRQTAGHSSCHVQGLRSVGETLHDGPGDMEQPPRRTADFNCVHQDICTKTQKSSLWLLAPLRTLSNWRYINVHIHSFIHSHNIFNIYLYFAKNRQQLHRRRHKRAHTQTQ